MTETAGEATAQEVEWPVMVSGIAFLFCFALLSCYRVFVSSCFRVFVSLCLRFHVFLTSAGLMAEVASKAAGKNTKREENCIMQHKFK